MLFSPLATSATLIVLCHVVEGRRDRLLSRQENAQKNFINASVSNAADVVLEVSTKTQGRNQTGIGPA